MKYSLCFLTYNEIEGCKLDIPKIDLSQFDEVFAVDGGSQDETIKYLKKFNIPVYIQKNKGYNAAYIEAFKICNSDVLIFFHPKGTIAPKYIYDIKTFFEAGNDLVIASRNIEGSQNEEDDRFLKPRKWFVLIIGIICSFLWRKKGYRVRDVLHGFRGIKVDIIKKIKPLDQGLSIDLEMVVRAYKFGYKCVEFPIIEQVRPHGVTKFKAWPTGKIILKYIVFELFRKD